MVYAGEPTGSNSEWLQFLKLEASTELTDIKVDVLAMEFGGRLDLSDNVVIDDEAQNEIYESVKQDNCTIFQREHS